MLKLKNVLILFLKDNQYDLEEELIHFEYPKQKKILSNKRLKEKQILLIKY